jgi:V/A-type H+/Na+-transporting ATPase subunit G/H
MEFLNTTNEARPVDDTLQRLLDAEVRAEKIAQQAEAEQEQIIQGALKEARAEEERFTARIPDLHRSDIAKAQDRADQTVAELKRRYDERHVLLRNQAEQREEEALAAAFQVLISPDI